MKRYTLVLGDLLAITIVTLIGFATHGEVGTAFLPRMSALFVPLVITWFALAPALGLFQSEITSNVRQLWRPMLAGLFAAPLALVPRGFILNAPILPLFAAILAGVFALGMLLWRGLYFLLNRKTKP